MDIDKRKSNRIVPKTIGEEIFKLMYTHNVPGSIVAKDLSKKYNVSLQCIYAHMRKVNVLIQQVQTETIEYGLADSIQKFEGLLQIAMGEQDFALAKGILVEIAKLRGLYTTKVEAKIDTNIQIDYVVPTEDTDFKEIDNDED